MTINYITEARGDVIVVRPSGTTDDPDELLDYIDCFLSDCANEKKGKILLDHRELFYDRRFAGTYDLALKWMDKMGSGHPAKVALLTRPERMEFVKVYETIGLSKGILIKAFDEPRMASAWLAS